MYQNNLILTIQFGQGISSSAVLKAVKGFDVYKKVEGSGVVVLNLSAGNVFSIMDRITAEFVIVNVSMTSWNVVIDL